MSAAAAPGGTGDDEAAGEPRGLLLCAPSFLAVDRLHSSFNFSRLGLTADHVQVVQPLFADDMAPAEPEPSLQQQQRAAEAEHQREESRVERS